MRKLIPFLLVVAFVWSARGQSPEAATFIDSFVEKNNFHGTILISKDAKTVYRKSFGYANLPFKVPNSPDTKYRIASLTKAFTSVLVLQLHEEGLLNLDKMIITYLLDYTGPAGDKVTVRQLLNMTSGMRNMEEGTSLETALKAGMPQFQLPHTLDEMYTKYCNDRMVSQPGERFDYNNAEFIILGKIIERVSGMVFTEALAARILRPLSMTNTGVLTQEKIVDNLADTYFYREDLKALANDLPVYWGNWYAAGAMYSTADDVSKFANALFDGKLLRQSTLDQMFMSGLGEYGLGVWVYKNYEINGRMFTIVKRPGFIMGARAMLFHVLEDHSTVIILSNVGTVSLDEFAAEIAKHVVK